MTTGYADLLARAAADPHVAGVVLTGSQARGTTTRHSDTDVVVVVPAHDGRWRSSHGPDVDVAVVSIAQLADVSDRWQRYAYRGARVVLDRLGGRIGEFVRAQATLTTAEADAMVRGELDGYLNFVYRAAKNRRADRPDLARLDEIEAAPWFLWTLFALYGRVRPYNSYLRWELTAYPLPAPWTADHLITHLGDRPSRLFPELEVAARAAGYGEVIDAWDDLAVLRADVGRG